MIVPLVLFVASAAFTLWRNAEVGVLVDFAYMVNIATRIAAGDVPYAQFPLAQAPLAFLTQAALIKLAGPHYAVQIGYAVIVGGIATALTYTIATRILEGSVRSPTALAAILCIPITPLGIYAIFPHPFYDPDACLFVLAAIGATLAARDRPSRRRWVVSGALLAIPIFVKQNIGGAFLVAVLAALAADAIARPQARSNLRWCLAGLAGALAVALAGLQLVVGIDHYLA
ncbi:MAG: glycosyltransferase family 39 protein, partial [Chloroflexota bacterium]|nr:glycosyltransferase family 39 protein [Chloroflexota bacterium]